ncbi:MAG: hypothetical protein RLZZ352_307 [Pseudomonadota bacterium]|jgi:uncharacterized protein (DUF486 family)
MVATRRVSGLSPVCCGVFLARWGVKFFEYIRQKPRTPARRARPTVVVSDPSDPHPRHFA